MECVRDEHDGERNAKNPRGTVVRVARTRVAVDEQRLHHHEKADAEQRVIATVI